ncbi:MAG: hypothetical protein UT33_C0009G0054 [Candidatus Peregrinibacteria bacterium GW2011_GWC2_39_14]|nr:MAG: hypothetical protein US92_C0005G0054 [Candidatus Peregrinibacteria bacterium GW2011_GWA2_38_36]KKR06603.1 MAG: hypothetical protein UT33_C0009G0054 [Candidatus Peregrinibacteria bacterium GW2011_GWC2_39_14]
MDKKLLPLQLVERFDHCKMWPMVPVTTPEKAPTLDERAEIDEYIKLGKVVIKEILGDVDTSHTHIGGATRDYYCCEEGHEEYRLLMTLLKGAKSVEQVQDLVAGYIFQTINELRDARYIPDPDYPLKRKPIYGEVRDVMIGRLPQQGTPYNFKRIIPHSELRNEFEHQERYRLHYHQKHIGATTGHYFRMPRSASYLMEFMPTLQQSRRYAFEPNHDCLHTLLADSHHVFPKHFPVGRYWAKRETPKNKRMTPSKLTRFFTLPGLNDYLEADGKMPDESIASNLTIIAEYICENRGAIYKNDIKPEDIDKWMKNKFKKYHPDLGVATYVWARLLGTEFEDTSLWIEQYILDLIEKENPWVFEAAGHETRKDYNYPKSLLILYAKALAVTDIGIPDKDKLQELLLLIPAQELLEAAMGSKNYKSCGSLVLLYSYACDRSRYIPTPDKYNDERCENDFYGYCLDLFQESFEPSHEWTHIEGFELLDPMAIDGYTNSRGWTALQERMKAAEEKMRTMAPSELMAFKIAVVDKLPEPYAEKALYLITDIAKKYTVSVSFQSHDTDAIANMASNGYDGERPELILPGGISLDELAGTGYSKARFTEIAELAILERHLRGQVRGDDALIKHLMAHRSTMMPGELIAPIPGSPNLEIIKIYGDSPDLLSLLTIATLLVYVGYDYDQIMKEIEMLQGELIDPMQSRNLTATVGAELEIVGATPEGQIVNPDRFGLLTNVVAMGNDKPVNELKTPPTMSAFMQKYLFNLITDERFQFIYAKMLWDVSARKDRSPTAVHVSVAMPKDIPFSADLVRKYMAPIHEMQWIASEMRAQVPRASSAGYVKDWRSMALLDTVGDKHPSMQVEDKSLSLDPRGDYGKQIEMIQLLSSAAVQYMREKGGLPMDPSGRIMAQIYVDFVRESKLILGMPLNEMSQVVASALMEKYADTVKSELNRPSMVKKSGIVWVE